MASRIAVSNQKGGVGKTMVAINLAGALNRQGHDVLFVDIDPQGNATEGLGLTDRYEPGSPNLYDVLLEDQSSIGATVATHPEMDVVPSNVEMFNAEPDLITSMRGRERLRQALDELDRTYDYVVVDTPPWLGILTDSALLACGNVVIPALAESTSTRALEILFDQIDTIEDQYGTAITERAVVANRVEQDGESTEMMEWFRDTFEPAIPVFEVRKRVVLKRAWGNGVSVFEHEEDCDMEAVFLDLAESLQERVPA
jgi:chromosome partitioning protein